MARSHKCWHLVSEWTESCPLEGNSIALDITYGKHQDCFAWLFFLLNWKIVDLQCCVSFRYAVKWLSNTHIHIFFFRFFSIIDTQGTEYSSLCYTVSPCCLFILYIVVCICWSSNPTLSLPPLSPLGTISLFSKFVNQLLFYK